MVNVNEDNVHKCYYKLPSHLIKVNGNPRKILIPNATTDHLLLLKYSYC